MLRNEPPLTFRATSSGLSRVGTAAGPSGGDRLHIDLRVAEQAHLDVSSVASSLVLPGPTAAESLQRIDVAVAPGGSLRWWPEPVVVAAGASHRSDVRLRVGDRADVIWVDETVLGRHGERSGRLRSRLLVDGPGGSVLRTGVDTGAPGWDGPAGTSGCRMIGQVLLMGRPALRLAGKRPLAPLLCTEDARGTVAPLRDGSRLVTISASTAQALRLAVRLTVRTGLEACAAARPSL